MLAFRSLFNKFSKLNCQKAATLSYVLKSHELEYNLASHKTPLIIIDGKQAFNKRLTKDIMEHTAPQPSTSKILCPVENYPLENNKRSQVYYPLIVAKIKSIKLSDLSPEVWKFHNIDEVMSCIEGDNSVNVRQPHKEPDPQESLIFKQKLQKFLRGNQLGNHEKFIQSLKWTWPFLTSVSVLESDVIHPHLSYRGNIECVAKFKGHPVVIEWKLLYSPKVKPILPKESAIRLSALMGAMNYDKNFNFQVTKGIIVMAYANGAPADIFVLSSRSSKMYWKMWLQMLKNKQKSIE